MRVAPVRADVHASVKTSETLINYEDEDPEIRRAYDAELAKRGIVPDMNYAAAGTQD